MLSMRERSKVAAAASEWLGEIGWWERREMTGRQSTRQAGLQACKYENKEDSSLQNNTLTEAVERWKRNGGCNRQLQSLMR